MAAAALEDKQRTYDLIQMVNPLNHGSTPAGIKKYKTEPYVIAADVYAVENHEGMGGWTWYTGSAGWMYQLLAESFFGLKRTGNRLTIKPCVPDSWNSFKIKYKFSDTEYHLYFDRNVASEEITISLDGVNQESNYVLLVNDQTVHDIKIILPVTKLKAESVKLLKLKA
jgi:cyclic beta-1,2-glucan synthetase